MGNLSTDIEIAGLLGENLSLEEAKPYKEALTHLRERGVDLIKVSNSERRRGLENETSLRYIIEHGE